MLIHTSLALALLASSQQHDGTVRVIDARTKAPIAGAAVYGVQEAKAPVWGTFWWSVEASTGDDGWAALPPRTDEADYNWTIVRAPGYAIVGTMATPRPDVEMDAIELEPAAPATIRLVDHLGRPLPLVHLGFCVGCGHTPDVASAVTDQNGEATLLCVGRGDREIADLYPVGEGVRMNYLDVDWDGAIDGGFETIAEPGGTLVGRLLKPDGTPAAGHAVGVPEIHRGPWTLTDRDGSFRLHGLETVHAPYLQVRDESGAPIAGFDGSRIGVERILRLPEEPWGDTDAENEAIVSLTVSVEGSDVDHAALWPDGVPGVLWDPATGWSTRFDASVGEAVEIEVPAGSFEIEVGGFASPFARRALGRVDVDADEVPHVIDCTLPPIRVARLEVSDVALDSRVVLIASNGDHEVVEFDVIEIAAGASRGNGVVASFAVPAEPFGLWLETLESGRFHRIYEIDGLLEGDDVLRAQLRER